ncbi:MAG: cytochrome c oxidase subunit II [Paracoccaceae bacterium]|nr:cytochrome c oxidase subunit II [Paracoccaceae bacterium]MDG2259914.1 cytochrome c oxidase subunit II [Paracoccaceae bacterium]
MRLLTTLLGLAATLMALPATAQEGLEIIGKPTDRGLGFQPAATELARLFQRLDGMVLVIITIISVFVIGLVIYALVRFNRRANPTPATFTHNSPLEVAWTIIPIIILIFIGTFSLPVLFKQQEIPEADITIKVTGYQWYWGYEYVDHDFGFESFLLQKDELEDHGYSQSEWLLATDTAVVVPIGKTIVMQITAADVIHAWTIPAFGVKQDAVPGRLAQLWFNAEREGVYFGQCSELCGKDHAYMPITVKVVSQEVYDDWLKGAIDEYADAGASDVIQIASLN